MNREKRMIVGITGASGAVYARRVTELLLAGGVEVHMVVTPSGERLLSDELGGESVCDIERVKVYAYRDVGAAIASGSFEHDGMVVVPCSSNTLSAIGTGRQENLLHRAAAVSLKERRRLVLVHREMPVSLIDIRNMEAVTLAGGIVCPASPGFYLGPGGIGDLVDFVAGRVLDLLGVEHGLDVRWGEGGGVG